MATVALAISSMSQAQTTDTSYQDFSLAVPTQLFSNWYWKLNLGRALVPSVNVAQSSNNPLVQTSLIADSTLNTVGLGLGWQFNKNFAVETNYKKLDSMTLNDSLGVPQQMSGKMFDVNLVARYQVFNNIPKFYPSVKLGLSTTSLNFTDPNSNQKNYTYKTTPNFGVGLNYLFDNNLHFGLDFTKYNNFAGQGVNVSQFDLGFKYYFK